MVEPSKTAARIATSKRKPRTPPSRLVDKVAPAYLAMFRALVPVALAAGRLQMRYHSAGVAIVTKADATPVTCADQESEALILAALQKLAPNIPIVAEEEAAAGRIPEVGRIFFLVDPLDGTREFICGRLEFTINIALVVDEVAVFGLVYAPGTGDFFVTPSKGQAAYAKIDPVTPPTSMPMGAFQQIKVKVPHMDGLVAVASRSHMNAETQALLSGYKVASCLSAGSSLKFCLVAKGDADIYPRVGRTSEWDTAAGQAILEAAGGSVTRLDRKPLRYGKADQRFVNPDYIAWGGQPFAPREYD
jgi:3'(2'), 5'-bisphosphate nucleotidase